MDGYGTARSSMLIGEVHNASTYFPTGLYSCGQTAQRVHGPGATNARPIYLEPEPDNQDFTSSGLDHATATVSQAFPDNVVWDLQLTLLQDRHVPMWNVAMSVLPQ